MDSQTSRKIIVAGGMAAVLVVGIVTFALLPHHGSSVAQVLPSPAVVPPAREVPATVAPTPEAPAAVAQIPDAPAVAHRDSVGSKIHDAANPAAVEPKVTVNRHLAKASTSADATYPVVTPAEATVDSSEKSPGETPATSADGAKSVDEVTPPSTASGTTTFAPATTEPAASDTGSAPK
jgi:hypothetical protein